jgi:hypothetical protein
MSDRLLGDPGVFVMDGTAAWTNWLERGHEAVMANLVAEDLALPGMAAPDEAARFLVLYILASAGTQSGFHVFVTHDSLVTATASRILGVPTGVDDWPWYLEAAFFWRDGEALQAAYRDTQRSGRSGPLCDLSSRDVIEFARREVAAVLGFGCKARFFLAGGAFKTLLTGRPPRDLDLWVPSVEDRTAIVAELDRRGARHLEERLYTEAFGVEGRVVEIQRKVEPATLEERLARFDIALSAVGVEHLPGGRWRAIIHPLALRSVDRRKALLLKPLVNWKCVLSTLERMRRYADELGYTVPDQEVAEVWRVFDSQSPEMQSEMIDRFDRTSEGNWGVREEALFRFVPSRNCSGTPPSR